MVPVFFGAFCFIISLFVVTAFVFDSAYHWYGIQSVSSSDTAQVSRVQLVFAAYCEEDYYPVLYEFL